MRGHFPFENVYRVNLKFRESLNFCFSTYKNYFEIQWVIMRFFLFSKGGCMGGGRVYLFGVVSCLKKFVMCHS